MNREIRKLTKKIDELQKQINYQNECIMDQSMIIQKLTEKLVVIPTYPSTPSIDPHFGVDIPYVPSTPSIDPHFGVDIPYVPCKGPDCENRTTTPVTHTSYDGTKTTLPVTLPEKWQMPKAGSVTEGSSGSMRYNQTSF